MVVSVTKEQSLRQRKRCVCTGGAGAARMLEAGTARHPPVQMDRCEFHNDREVTRQMMMDGETGQEMPSGQMLAPPSTPKYFGPQDAFPAIRFPPSPPFAPTDNTLSAEKVRPNPS